jgi:hypothetical protein
MYPITKSETINFFLNYHHLHGLGPMACSGSIVHRILGLPVFLLPSVDIPMLFLGDDVYPFFVDVLLSFLYIALFVYGLVKLLLFFSFLMLSSRVHPFTARRNFISADCIILSSFRLNIQPSLHIKGMKLPWSYTILIGLLSWYVFPILVVSCHTLLEILPVLFAHLRHSYKINCNPSN